MIRPFKELPVRIILIVTTFSFWALAQKVEMKVLNSSAPLTAKNKQEMEKKTQIKAMMICFRFIIALIWSPWIIPGTER